MIIQPDTRLTRPAVYFKLWACFRLFQEDCDLGEKYDIKKSFCCLSVSCKAAVLGLGFPGSIPGSRPARLTCSSFSEFPCDLSCVSIYCLHVSLSSSTLLILSATSGVVAWWSGHNLHSMPISFSQFLQLQPNSLDKPHIPGSKASLSLKPGNWSKS